MPAISSKKSFTEQFQHNKKDRNIPIAWLIASVLTIPFMLVAGVFVDISLYAAERKRKSLIWSLLFAVTELTSMAMVGNLIISHFLLCVVMIIPAIFLNWGESLIQAWRQKDTLSAQECLDIAGDAVDLMHPPTRGNGWKSIVYFCRSPIEYLEARTKAKSLGGVPVLPPIAAVPMAAELRAAELKALQDYIEAPELPKGTTRYDYKSRAINERSEAEKIGGHKEALDKLYREVFQSRKMTEDLLKKVDAKHCKGVLLYGPPGTGKTLIARVIGEELTSPDNITVVNGSELISDYQGRSVMNFNKIFLEADKAWKRDGDKSELYVIIMDEIDTVFPKRSSGSTAMVKNDMVAAALTRLDGINAQNNIVIIGTTNNRHNIDPALTRPGRLEVSLEIGLPNEADRLDILKIRTEKLREKGLLAEEVNLEALAKRTKNYSGAELANLVKKAINYALIAIPELNKKPLILFTLFPDSKVDSMSPVTSEHFERAFSDISIDKSHGSDDDGDPEKYQKKTLDSRLEVVEIGGYEKELKALEDGLLFSRKMQKDVVEAYSVTHSKGALLYGPPGTGKTSIARAVAQKLTTPDKIAVVNGSELVSTFQGGSVENFNHIFAEADAAWKKDGPNSDTFVYIFDEMDALFTKRDAATSKQYGSSVKGEMTAALLAKLQGVNGQHNIVILGTTNNLDAFDPALVRSGRLGLQVKIDLPTEEDRLGILESLTKKYRTNGLFDESIDLSELAKRTEKYSGADLTGLVGKAVNYTLSSMTSSEPAEISGSSSENITKEMPKITSEHFEKALLEMSDEMNRNVAARKTDSVLSSSPAFLNSPEFQRLLETSISPRMPVNTAKPRHPARSRHSARPRHSTKLH